MTATAECNGCGAVVRTYRESRAERLRYCSQNCASDNRPTDGVNRGRSENTVRVTREVRDALKRVHPKRNHNQTIAALAGKHLSRGNRPTDGVNSGRKHTGIRVSDDCRELLGELQEDMSVDALGDVVAVLIEEYS